MMFNWDLALTSLAGGLLLLLFAYFSWKHEKSIFAPGTAMLLTWSGALTAHSFLGTMGFYHLAKQSVLLFVLGSAWFAIIAVFTTRAISHHKEIRKTKPTLSESMDSLNYNRILVLWLIIAIVIYPISIFNILKFGSSFVEISTNIKSAALSGEKILPSIILNLFIFLGILTNIVLYGVVQKKVKITYFAALVIPLVIISLIVSGRSWLVPMTIGWLVIIAVFSEKLKPHHLLLPIALLLFTLYFGAVWLNKFDNEEKSILETISAFLAHIFGYLFQGPVLFSRYFTGEITVEAGWDFLNSACHMLSKVGLCEPLPQHLESSDYGHLKYGNVYTMYFSILPRYGFLGLAAVFGGYAIFSSVLYKMMQDKSIFAMVVYPYIFSAIVLSLFSDGIGYSFYWLIKVFIACVFIKVFFSDSRNTQKKWFWQ